MSGISVALAILLQTSAAPAPTQAAAPAGDETVICRRIPVTGYVGRKEKICKTKAEWRAADEQGNGRARSIVDQNAGSPF